MLCDWVVFPINPGSRPPQSDQYPLWDLRKSRYSHRPDFQDWGISRLKWFKWKLIFPLWLGKPLSVGWRISRISKIFENNLWHRSKRNIRKPLGLNPKDERIMPTLEEFFPGIIALDDDVWECFCRVWNKFEQKTGIHAINFQTQLKFLLAELEKFL